MTELPNESFSGFYDWVIADCALFVEFLDIIELPPSLKLELPRPEVPVSFVFFINSSLGILESPRDVVLKNYYLIGGDWDFLFIIWRPVPKPAATEE